MPPKPKPLSYTTKTQALSAHLATLARKLGPGARLPTMQQLSEELGISVMTLNRALSELEAQGILMRRQGSGTYVSEKFATSVGLVYDRTLLGTSASPFGELLLNEAQERAVRGGEKFSLYLADPSSTGAAVHDDLVEAVATRKISGVLTVTRNEKAIAWLEKKVPVVSLSYRDIAPYRVRIHHAQTAYLGARELARRGCKRIALWIPAGVGIGPEAGSQTFEELEFFKKALKECGLEYEPELVFNLDKLSSDVGDKVNDNREQGRAAARETFDKIKPDGIVSIDDAMTLGALAEMNKMGVRAGHDISIASHTNKGSQLLYAFAEELILLEVDPAEVASAMFSLLEARLRGDEIEEKVISIAPHLAPTS
jgi:DNA-binding LacI/PurR family transcriptional regulator